MEIKKHHLQRAYTLAEVLIVVVIIATLASLVIPRFATQREKAATAEAITMMSAIHRALLIYEDEHKVFPEALTTRDKIQRELGISIQESHLGWSFSTNALGGVIARSVHGNLTLASNGSWNGDGNYTPGTGIYWPHLNR